MSNKTDSSVKTRQQLTRDKTALSNSSAEQLRKIPSNVDKSPSGVISGLNIPAAQMKDLKQFFTELINSKFADLSSQIKSDLSVVKTELKSISEKVENLTNDYTNIKQENTNIYSELAQLQSRVVDLEQYSRINNIEIRGLPETSDENTDVVLSAVAKAINVKFEPNQVCAAHRVNSFDKKEPKPIVVKFVSRKSKASWLKNYAEFKKKENVRCLNASNINKALGNGNVYINEHLCFFRKKLSQKVKMFAKNNKFKHVFTSNGNIFIKKEDSSKKIKINDLSDLDSINVKPRRNNGANKK